MENPFKKLFAKRETEAEKIFEADPVGARDIIAPASIEIGQSYLKLGDKIAKRFFIFS